MSEELNGLLDATRTIEMSHEEREEQKRSFAYGNSHFDNEQITREMIDRVADKEQAQPAPNIEAK